MLAVAVIATGLLLALPNGGGTVLPATLDAGFHTAASGGPTATARSSLSGGSTKTTFIPASQGVSFLTSHLDDALFGSYFDNGTWELAVFNGTYGSIRVLQVYPDTDNLLPDGALWCGTRFLLADYNFTTGNSTFQSYTHARGLRNVTLPINPEGQWIMLGVTDGRLYLDNADNGGAIVALNSTTLRFVENLTGAFPVGTQLNTVEAEDGRLYVGGAVYPEESLGIYGSYPLYGYVTLRNDSFTQLSPTLSTVPTFQSSIDSIVTLRNQVYFGGGGAVDNFTSYPFTLYDTEPILMVYHPATGVLVNLSGSLPLNSSVFGLLPMNDTVGVVSLTYNYPSGAIIGAGSINTPGFFAVHNGRSLANETRIVGDHFAVFGDSSSVSDGLVFLGGYDTATNSTELRAMAVGLLD